MNICWVGVRVNFLGSFLEQPECPETESTKSDNLGRSCSTRPVIPDQRHKLGLSWYVKALRTFFQTRSCHAVQMFFFFLKLTARRQ